jgi:KaiC/GvpD/RAD55 family RecA-like ATPase
MLLGGIPEGKTVMVTGHCGTGKTLLGFHFLRQGALENQSSVLLTFEEGREKLLDDGLQVGMDLAALEKAGKLRIVGGQFGTLRFVKEKARASLDDLIEEVREIVKETGAKRVVVDSINLFTMLFDSDAERRSALGRLIHVLGELGCTSLLTCEVPEDSKRFGWFGFEEFMADGVVNLDRQLFDGNHERSITVIKMRGSGHSTGIRALDITGKGLMVYAEQEPMSVRYAHGSGG